jgi:hypothetical protein
MGVTLARCDVAAASGRAAQRILADGGKAVQMCLANEIRAPEAIDKLRPVK